MEQQIKNLTLKYKKSVDRYNYLLNTKNNYKNTKKEHFPLVFRNRRNILIFDTNVFLEKNLDLFKSMANSHYGIIIPRVLLNELDGLKKKFVNDKEKMILLSKIANFLEEYGKKELLYIQSFETSWMILNNFTNLTHLEAKKRINNDEEFALNTLHYQKTLPKKGNICYW